MGSSGGGARARSQNKIACDCLVVVSLALLTGRPRKQTSQRRGGASPSAHLIRTNDLPSYFTHYNTLLQRRCWEPRGVIRRSILLLSENSVSLGFKLLVNIMEAGLEYVETPGCLDLLEWIGWRSSWWKSSLPLGLLRLWVEPG